ncbi:glycosyltransferase [Novipirellula sp. SH528]|uniref:glycosyltransferase n=1 Tax=Novipirellula sp. SH528 TaxID=3454466 RepID=UPI003FA0CA50
MTQSRNDNDASQAPRTCVSDRRLTSPITVRWAHHRSGWGNVQAVVSEQLLHPEGECLFFGELEDALFQIGPFRKSWIGVAHQTFQAPPHMAAVHGGRSDLEFLLNYHPNLSLSLPNCRGIFTLSEHVAFQLRDRLTVPIEVLRLPTELAVPQFSYQAYEANRRKTLVQLGCWLRRFYPIYDMPVRGFRRMWLTGGDFDHRHAVGCEGGRKRRWVHVKCPPRLSNEAFDDLLSKNIMLVGLWEANANNSIVECIARGTPVLTNPLPAVREYLGDDYPFYFEDLREAAVKLRNNELIQETAAYLQRRKAHLWSTETFIQRLIQSDIYTSLPGPRKE